MRSMFTFITLLELAHKNTSKEFFLLYNGGEKKQLFQARSGIMSSGF
jgi:hypothetical protein